MSKAISIQPIHTLKIWPKHFKSILSGKKTFEVRKNDRKFKVGDSLHLVEWNPDNRLFTGAFIMMEVTYILKGGEFGIAKDHVVMSVKLIR